MPDACFAVATIMVLCPLSGQHFEPLGAVHSASTGGTKIDRIKLTQVDRAELTARRARRKQPRRLAAMAAPSLPSGKS